MNLVVQKFGGTSVGSLERIRHVAHLVKKQLTHGPVLVVVSAMAGETDRLLGLAREMGQSPHPEATDLLLSTGEAVSCALTAMALQSLGVPSLPLLGHQVGIQTDCLFTNAKIKRIDTTALQKHLEKGIVPVVAGFQGVDENGFITTLGRGGSDTSAVALAIALKAERCDIYTDVDGVHTADPRLVPHAKKLRVMGARETMELASVGAKVLHMRCVELAAKYKMPVRVLSTFQPDEGGTLITDEQTLESPLVSAVATQSGHCLFHINLGPANRGFPAAIFSPLADAQVNVDVILETPPTPAGTSSIFFTVPRADGQKAKDILQALQPQVVDENLCKVSVVGLGMRNHSGVASRIFEALKSHDIPILLVTTSEITVSVLVKDELKQKATLALHDAFGLGRP